MVRAGRSLFTWSFTLLHTTPMRFVFNFRLTDIAEVIYWLGDCGFSFLPWKQRLNFFSPVNDTVDVSWTRIILCTTIWFPEIPASRCVRKTMIWPSLIWDSSVTAFLTRWIRQSNIRIISSPDYLRSLKVRSKSIRVLQRLNLSAFVRCWVFSRRR